MTRTIGTRRPGLCWSTFLTTARCGNSSCTPTATVFSTCWTASPAGMFARSWKEPEPKKSFSGGGAGPKPAEVGQFFLRAFDPKTGAKKWEYPMTGPGESWAGTVSTAGGVIFFGDDDGHLVGVDARNGKHLWHFQMGEGLTASPITYAVDGNQYE